MDIKSRGAARRRMASPRAHGQVSSGIELDEPWATLASGAPPPASWPAVTSASPTRPRGLYACTKLWGEALGRSGPARPPARQPASPGRNLNRAGAFVEPKIHQDGPVVC
jgi:hypothetical protein